MQKISSHKLSPPLSCANFGVNIFSLLFFPVVMIGLHAFYPQMSTVMLATICLLATAVTLWFVDFLKENVHQRASTELSNKPGPVDKQRVLIKLIGLYGTFLIIVIVYCLAPFYRSSFKAVNFYSHFFSFLKMLAPWIMALSAVYFWVIDPRQKNPYDSYWHMGCLLIGRFKEVNRTSLAEHGRVWFIKGFFTPFMFSLLVAYMDSALSFDWRTLTEHFFVFFNRVLDLMYTIDVIYGVLGYILTVRLLDTHIRSTEPTILGWLVCLICYHPFARVGAGLLQWDDGRDFNHWLIDYPVLSYGFAFAIVFLVGVYALATVAIGYRMSNLTYRGLISSGPYRFTKHPAYVCKVASWWLIVLPFFSLAGPIEAMKHTLALIFLTGIYYIRAKTEENHLSNYPEYVEYANWMNEHGLFRFIGKLYPALRYSEEKSKAWKSVVWFKKADDGR